VLDRIAVLAEEGGGGLDADTVLSGGSWAAALRAAGTALAAIEALDRDEASSAFLALRPPGHHATSERSMGFCLLNSVAVAAAALAERGERVLVVDYDAHHGNGTQEIFWRDDRVAYVSVHQWPLYPGTGRVDEIGAGPGRGTTLNVPVPPGTTGDVYAAAFDELIVPFAERFAPTWVLASVGFDAHRADPLARLALSAGDYADLAGRVAGLVPRRGRLVAFVEGGYDLDALQTCAAATVPGLIGERLPTGSGSSREAPTAGGPGRQAVDTARTGWARRSEKEEEEEEEEEEEGEGGEPGPG